MPNKFERFDKNLQKQLLEARKRIKLINQMLVDANIVCHKMDTMLKRKDEEIEMLRERIKIPLKMVAKHDIKKIGS